MNVWQVARQLKDTLAARAWTDSPTQPVFGKVIVSAGVAERALGQLRFPFCQILPQDAEVDAQAIGLENQRYLIRIVARVAADPWGESIVIGGPRQAGQGGSGGRGLLELEEEVLAAAGEMIRTNGIRLRLQWRSSVAVEEVEGLGVVGTKEIQVDAWTTTTRSYEAPSRLAGTIPGGGATVLTWTLPPARYDRNALILRRAAGSTAPATTTAGTGVAVGALVTTVADAPGVGTFSYSLFMGYDELNSTPTTSDRFSAASTLTITLS